MIRKSYEFIELREYILKDNVDYPNDKRIHDIVIRFCEELGEHGRVTIRFEGIQHKILVLTEADTSELCMKYVNMFQEFMESEYNP